jgi:hypothetical protein
MPHNPLHYVLLRHDGVPSPHFDLLIDISPGAPLLAFRCDDWPPTSPIARQPDHRRIYLDYEGPISNNRGQVRQAAQGTLIILEFSPSRLKIQLIPGPLLDLAIQ